MREKNGNKRRFLAYLPPKTRIVPAAT